MTRRRPLPLLALLAVTAAWGSTFFMLKGVLTRLPVTDTLALRFLIAAAAVWLVAPRAVRTLTRAERRAGVALGLVFAAAQLLQTYGLRTTAASVSGFVTGMYVVFTPLLAAALLRSRIGRNVWLAAVLATAGLAVLSLTGFALGGGAALTLVSALLYAVHIVGLGAWTRPGRAVGLTLVQLTTVALVCTLAALPGGLAVPVRTADWLALAWMGVGAGAVALLVQTWAQAHLAATRAAVIMTMEPVFAGVFAVALGGEVLGPRVVVGGGLVLAAMLLAELPHGAVRSYLARDPRRDLPPVHVPEQRTGVVRALSR